MRQDVFSCVLAAIVCTEPNPLPAGYTITGTASLEVPTFGVTVECAAGYSGAAVATACAVAGPFTLSGCAGTSA